MPKLFCYGRHPADGPLTTGAAEWEAWVCRLPPQLLPRLGGNRPRLHLAYQAPVINVVIIKSAVVAGAPLFPVAPPRRLVRSVSHERAWIAEDSTSSRKRNERKKNIKEQQQLFSPLLSAVFGERVNSIGWTRWKRQMFHNLLLFFPLKEPPSTTPSSGGSKSSGLHPSYSSTVA